MAETREKRPAQKTKRPVGRPRADGKPQLTKEAVFLVAAKHIARDGYAGASIRKIAAELKAAPASVFNLFPTKDALLNELLIFAAAPSMAFYAELEKLTLSPEVALFKSIMEEVIAVASADRDFPAIFYLPELAKPGFEPAQETRATMVAHYRSLIEAGQNVGVLLCDIPALSAEQVFQLTETSIIAQEVAAVTPPEKAARATARFCLRGLLVNPTDLDAIEQAADQVSLAFVLPEKV
ncbi:TetR/AcrR family transcriptional regulator [Parvibaculaceae bacterium PLY_AMNH_Bact1]|nr:TetR/AcrR family transcriptional regulator [Parvibaculaceae bacterium PLY_AMNH_Bact1]